MSKRGLTVTEVADRMRQHLPAGESFATSNLSHYRQGRSVPRPDHLKALALALGVTLAELTAPDSDTSVQTRASEMSGPADNAADAKVRPRRSAREATSVIRIEDLGTDMRLVVDQRVSWEKAIRILNVLKGDGA